MTESIFMALLKGIHLSSWHWEDKLSEKCSGEEPLFFMSECFRLLADGTNKGGTAIHKPRPFLGVGFFCVHFYNRKNKGGRHDAGTFTRTAGRSVAKD